jgi:tRNA-dihydrouridine synthase 1
LEILTVSGNPSTTSSSSFLAQVSDRPLILAPMAEVNDLPFRLLVRRHGIGVCYTGMINAEQWVTSRRYQRRIFNTCPSDRPLVVQLGGSDHEHLLRAATDLSPFCDAIDLNLGCTQCQGRG